MNIGKCAEPGKFVDVKRGDKTCIGFLNSGLRQSFCRLDDGKEFFGVREESVNLSKRNGAKVVGIVSVVGRKIFE